MARTFFVRVKLQKGSYTNDIYPAEGQHVADPAEGKRGSVGTEILSSMQSHIQ
jgi:hypothetical protein